MANGSAYLAGCLLKQIAPALTGKSYKGQMGKIGVVGGSKEYTGAPYFSSMSSLRAGGELVYVFTTVDAAPVIKGYSPELMVTPVASIPTHEDTCSAADAEGIVSTYAGGVVSLLSRISTLLIGPGLGRHPLVLRAVEQVIDEAKSRNLPLVLDADALFLVAQKPSCVLGYKNAILTPNAAEFERIRQGVGGTFRAEGALDTKHMQNVASEDVALLARRLGGVTILRKGPVDVISNGTHTMTCDLPGSLKRPGGIGDCLAGTIATFVSWWSTSLKFQGDNPDEAADKKTVKKRKRENDVAGFVLPVHAAATVLRLASEQAYSQHKRGLVASDIIPRIAPVVDDLSTDAAP
eukprot:m.88617 g.88617  ORF g.88617 m.88617 type:complete len:350 (+) comp16433_c0_seq1:579-1628(+)